MKDKIFYRYMCDLKYLMDYLYEEEKIQEVLKSNQRSDYNKRPKEAHLPAAERSAFRRRCGCVEVCEIVPPIFNGPCCREEWEYHIIYTCISCKDKR